MKSKLIVNFLLFFLLVSTVLLGNAIENSEKTALMGKVWGLLKYYHPKVIGFDDNWDNVIIDFYGKMRSAESPEEINQVIEDIINIAGGVNLLDQRQSDGFSGKRSDLLRWIEDSDLLNSRNQLKLKIIAADSVDSVSRYVKKTADGRGDFSDEKRYSGIGDYPAEMYRVLGVIRYWNLIHYFYSSKSIVFEDWSLELKGYIESAVEASDKYQYNWVIRSMVSSLKDAQANLYSETAEEIIGLYGAPLKLKFIDGKFIISEILYSRIEGDSNFMKGDQVVGVDGSGIDDLYNRFLNQVSYTSKISCGSRICSVILNSNSRNGNISVKRGETVLNFPVRRYPLEDIKEDFTNLKDTTLLKRVSDKIVYVNLSNLKPSDIEEAIKAFGGVENIILDFRYGANPDSVIQMAGLMCRRSVAYVKYTAPSLDIPGTFVLQDPFYIGADENPSHYQGKIHILVDSSIQGGCEVAVMAFQALDDSVTIGEPTAGSGDIPSEVTIPGGIKVGFSTRGVFYPGGNGIYSSGVKIDVPVKLTVDGISNSKDEILEKALEEVSNK